ncbi:MAG: hypothetical protein EU539_06635 [Promethearchaeota archaeon]|nr:MAG: hypothetical protein EU539_06635 [Candidatus Lokiarchaeota archaeon]
MNKKSTIALNIVTVVGFILYGIGIILYTTVLNQRWGNAAVDLGIQILGPIAGTIIVLSIEIGILYVAYFIKRFEKITHATNIFLCWFWIFSLYQCAINCFLSLQSMPNEPVNLFFKTFWPNFWYPVKELFFIIISSFLTWAWFRYLEKDMSMTKLDKMIIFIICAAFWLTIVLSQLLLINTEKQVYS